MICTGTYSFPKLVQEAAIYFKGYYIEYIFNAI